MGETTITITIIPQGYYWIHGSLLILYLYTQPAFLISKSKFGCIDTLTLPLLLNGLNGLFGEDVYDAWTMLRTLTGCSENVCGILPPGLTTEGSAWDFDVAACSPRAIELYQSIFVTNSGVQVTGTRIIMKGWRSAQSTMKRGWMIHTWAYEFVARRVSDRLPSSCPWSASRRVWGGAWH